MIEWDYFIHGTPCNNENPGNSRNESARMVPIASKAGNDAQQEMPVYRRRKPTLICGMPVQGKVTIGEVHDYDF
jgi:hypothetical protein